MHLRRSFRLSVVAAAATLLLAGCGDDGTENESDPTTDDEQALPAPQHEQDDSIRLPLGFISPEGHSGDAPINDEGQVTIREEVGTVQRTEIARTDAFGCNDTVSVVASVPTVTDDPTLAAVEFLVQDQHYYHGDPAFRNPLAISDDLDVDTVGIVDDVVTVELSGQPNVRSTCEAWQIHTQLDATARAASGASRAEILLDGEPLAASLGIDPGETSVPLQRISEIIR
ncbi:hypothetical protein [Nesterenkonia suensis]